MYSNNATNYVNDFCRGCISLITIEDFESVISYYPAQHIVNYYAAFDVLMKKHNKHKKHPLIRCYTPLLMFSSFYDTNTASPELKDHSLLYLIERA